MSSEEDKNYRFIEQGFEEAIDVLRVATGNKVHSFANGLLYVAEFNVGEASSSGRIRGQESPVTVQIIVNPWGWPNSMPLVDVIGIDQWSRPPRGTVDAKESTGRFRLNGTSLKSEWTEGASLGEFANAVAKFVVENSSGMKLLPSSVLPQRPMQDGLLYPNGSRLVLQQQREFAKKKGWELLDRTGEEKYKKNLELQAQLLFETCNTQLMAAKTEEELDAIDFSSFEGEQLEQLEKLRMDNRKMLYEQKFNQIVIKKDEDPFNTKPVGHRVRRLSRRRAKKKSSDEAANEAESADTEILPPVEETPVETPDAPKKVRRKIRRKPPTDKVASNSMTDGWSPQAAKVNIPNNQTIIIDGSNIVLRKKPAMFSTLEDFVGNLKSMGFTEIYAIADASLRHKVGDKEEFEKKYNGNDSTYMQSPRGVPADVPLLQFAYQKHAVVITNDHFMDHKDTHPDEHEWFKSHQVQFKAMADTWILTPMMDCVELPNGDDA